MYVALKLLLLTEISLWLKAKVQTISLETNLENAIPVPVSNSVSLQCYSPVNLSLGLGLGFHSM